ncbi:MAG: helix-turn-helix transcriptional regulator [Desulfotomaculum sp.]|nr:helix-turn-helix transcriptional regulator [Desulfotomaculum sp.]
MGKNLTCEITCIHTEIVNKIKSKMLDDEEVTKISSLFKALGDPTRFKILYCLRFREMCVCDISAILNLSQSATSHQLRVLRNLRLVKYRKEGKMVFYSLEDDHIFRILDEGLNHIKHD